MSVEQTIWALVIVLTLVAAFVDFRTRKIPNWLTVPSLFAGITLHAVTRGWPGAKLSLEGAGLALALVLPLVLLRALGAGDWKLMGAVGAFLGPIMVLFVLFGSILVSGLMAMVEMIRAGRARETFRNLVVLVRGFISFGLRPNSKVSLDNPELLKLPFGVAVAVSTVAVFCAARWLL
jgi:prepilin peptidase CpaA